MCQVSLRIYALYACPSWRRGNTICPRLRIFDSFDQAENRLHMQKAILSKLSQLNRII